MSDSIVLTFSLIAMLLCGVLISSLAYIKEERPILNEHRLWLSSITLVIVGIAIFAYATATTSELIKSNSISFTFANTFYLSGLVFQAIFCRSLRVNISKQLIVLCCVGMIVFGIHFEYLRGAGYFSGRVLEVAMINCVCLITQAYEVIRLLRSRISVQLKYFLLFTVIELALVLARVVIAATQVNPILTIDDIPFSLLTVMVFSLGVNVLTYLSILAFWIERAALQRKNLKSENIQISQLLDEREALIGSLMVANKSAAAGAMSASLAHELNQPLGASRINMFTLKKILEAKKIKEPQVLELLDRLELDNHRAGDIVHSLRSMFKRHEVDIQLVNLSELVTSVISLVKGECLAKHIELKVDMPNHCMVRASSVELQQVILNLLTNAVQALDTSAQSMKMIEVTYRVQEDFIHLNVEDNGSGVPEMMVPKLFRLFSTRKAEGLGVGLWLSQYIMKHLGGEILYAPRPYGGSSFSIVLPISPNIPL